MWPWGARYLVRVPTRWTHQDLAKARQRHRWLVLILSVGMMAMVTSIVADQLRAGDAPMTVLPVAVGGYGLSGVLAVTTVSGIRATKDVTGRPVTGRRGRRGRNDGWTQDGPDGEWRVDTSAPPIHPSPGGIGDGVVDGSDIVASRAVMQLDPDTVVASQGFAWTNAAARLAIACGGPVLLTVAVVTIGVRPGSVWVLAAALWWPLALWLGTLNAWEALNGMIFGQVQVDPGYTVLTGSTVGPLRRTRAVRLNHVARVRYIQVPNVRYFIPYLLITDLDGGRLLIEKPSLGLRRLVIHAISKSPNARVGYVTSRRLAGIITFWPYPLSYPSHLLILFGAVAVAFELAGLR